MRLKTTPRPCMNYALFNRDSTSTTKYDFDVFEEEQAWVYDPLVLVWPPQNLLKFSPFDRFLTRAERLNAHARLTLLIGLGIYWYQNQHISNNGLLVLFLTLVFVVQQGVAFLNSEDVYQTQNNIEYYKQRIYDSNARASALEQLLFQLTQRQTPMQERFYKQQQYQLFDPIV